MAELFRGFLELSAVDFAQRFLPLASPSSELVLSLARCLEVGGEEAAEQAVGSSERRGAPAEDLGEKKRLVCTEVCRN